MEENQMNEITTKEIEEKLAAYEKLTIIDVREDDEVETGVIPGVIHIPLGEVPTKIEELDQNEHYYIICRSGGRSGKACDYLIEKGYHATNIAGGMLAW